MKNLGIYFDADNISHKDVKYIMDEIKSKGNILILRAYGDWSELKAWKSISVNNGIEPVQCNRIRGKNSSDIKLCVDLMDTLFTNSLIDEYYIITSDADYIHVISKIRMRGKKVNIIGSKRSNSALRSSCDKFTDINILRKSETKKVIRKELIDDIIDIIDNKDGEINLSYVKDILIKKYQFDERAYGFNSFRKFFDSILGKKYNVVNIKQRGAFIELRN